MTLHIEIATNVCGKIQLMNDFNNPTALNIFLKLPAFE